VHFAVEEAGNFSFMLKNFHSGSTVDPGRLMIRWYDAAGKIVAKWQLIARENQTIYSDFE